LIRAHQNNIPILSRWNYRLNPPFSGGRDYQCWFALLEALPKEWPMEGEDLLPLLRKLQSVSDPTEAEHRALAELRPTIKMLDAQEDIVRECERPNIVCLILEGFACRYATVPSGRRQILSFHIPGDIPDLQSLFIKVMDHNLAPLVPTKGGADLA
jgi:hypothetical protein